MSNENDKEKIYNLINNIKGKKKLKPINRTQTNIYGTFFIFICII